jgi:hypothetical protein
MKNDYKFISLTGLYTEVGVSFTNILNWEKSKEWRQILNKNIFPEGKMSSNYKNYNLELTLSSSLTISQVTLRGPRIDRRNKAIGYVIYVPYVPVVSSKNKLEKLTEYFKEGVMGVLKELNYSEKSIQESVKGITE